MSLTLLDLTKEKFISVLNELGNTNVDHTSVSLRVANQVSGNIYNIEITPNGNKYTGSKIVPITKLHGLAVSKIFIGHIAVAKDATVDQVITAIWEQRGLRIDQGTVGTINWTNDTEGTIEFAGGSIFSVKGGIQLSLKVESPLLSSVVTQHDIGEFRLNSDRAAIRLYGNDFSSIGEQLAAWTVGRTLRASDVDMIHNATNKVHDLTNINYTDNLNTTQQTTVVTYNGLTTDPSVVSLANQDYNHVMILEFTGRHSGSYVLHYNRDLGA